MQTIFVSIAAYRDPQLVPTVEDCLARARYPDRLRFGICWQHGPEEAGLPWMQDPRFRIIDVDWKDSRGVCWARAQIMARYAGETFYLQLDSHHRFADDWDLKAIDELRRAHGEKPVLTTYAPSFVPGKSRERLNIPMQMELDRFTAEGIPLFRPGHLRDWRASNRPRRARFLSAHFLFTPGTFVADVPYDSDLYFLGEEFTLAIRAFSHGYDLYHPAQVIVWHEYTREYREHKHWSDHVDQGVPVPWYERDRASLDKVRQFLAEPHVGTYGLGTVRSFAEYEVYAGISIRHRCVQDYTREGLEPPNPPAGPEWTDRVRSYALQLVIDRQSLPADIADFEFWYVGIHDEWGQEIYRHDADRREIGQILDGDLLQARVARTFDSDRVPATWTVWPVSHSRGWLDRIDGVVDPQQAAARKGL